MKQNSDSETYLQISGDWQGYYIQNGKKFNLKAFFLQKDDRLMGTMIDLENEDVRSFDEITAKLGIAPERKTILENSIRALIPSCGNEEVLVKLILPNHSEVNGLVTGNNIKFKKIYMGELIAIFQVEGAYSGG